MRKLCCCALTIFFFLTAVCGAKRWAPCHIYSRRSTPLRWTKGFRSLQDRCEGHATNCRHLTARDKHEADLIWSLYGCWSWLTATPAVILWFSCVQQILLCSAVFLYLYGFLTTSDSFSWELPGRKRHKWGDQDATYANLPSSCSFLLSYASAWQV